MKTTKLLLMIVSVLGFIQTGWAQNGDPNLVGWWQLDEGTGTMALDSSGYGNDGTFQGSPQWVDGRIGGALDLNGTDAAVDVGNPDSLNINEQITLACWIQMRNAGDGNHHHFVGKGDRSYVIKQNSASNLEFVVYIGGWKVATSPLTAAFNNVWHHVAGAYDGSQIKLYLDGALVGSTSQTGGININTDPVRIGSEIGRRYTNGLIDDVRIYDRALSAAEIKQLANPELASNPIPADNSVITETEMTLEWTAGAGAVQHEVYFGEDKERLQSVATVDSAAYGPVDLEIGKTYYWRVDEIAADNTVNTGNVWTFTVQGLNAYGPGPADGAKYVDLESDLTWNGGFNAESHDVYLGLSDTIVRDADNNSPEFRGNQTDLIYDPGTLSYDTIYFWRIDERQADGTVIPGDVWQFKTLPETGGDDPSLVGWWRMDDGEGTTVLDWSGYDHHGLIIGDPNWTEGILEGALQFDGIDDAVDLGNPEGLNISDVVTVMAWVNMASAADGTNQSFITKGRDSYGLRHAANNSIEFRLDEEQAILTQAPIDASFGGEWHHVAGSFDGTDLAVYIDGTLQSTASAPGTIPQSVYNVNLARESVGNRFLFEGLMDDARIYNRVLTEDDIAQAMRGDPQLAWSPSPASGTIHDIVRAKALGALTWTPGDDAVQHDVYLGTDKVLVSNANTETTDVYQGRQDANSIALGSVDWGTTYYWRIDEINADDSVKKGRVWSYTVADYLIIDNFEDYTYDGCDRIYYTWRDGFSFSQNDDCGIDGYSGNGTGMTVGVVDQSYGPEQVIVHTGRQSLPLTYDNESSPYYSETDRTFAQEQNWMTQEGRDLSSLTLWLRGRPASPNGFTADGNTYTVTGSGADIFGVSDQFHYVYMPLNGDGEIIVRVDSIENVDNAAKAGVMIREGLDPDAANVMLDVTPNNLVEWITREFAGVASTSSVTDAGSITLPHWLRLRREGTVLTGEHSADGQNWELIGGASSIAINMFGDVYIGLAVTSRVDQETPCEAVFSNVEVTGGTGSVFTTSMDIGLETNDPANLYVTLQDAGNVNATVNHGDDPNAVLTTDWLEWSIPLSDFSNQGVDLTRIRKMIVGVGDKAPDGGGKLYLDDIRLYPADE